MMRLSMELRGLDDPFVMRVMGALGGGMFAQRTCGTLTGGACLLSSYFPQSEGAETAAYPDLVRQLVAWFEKTYGTTECRDLAGAGMATAAEVCPRLMAETFAKCMELLEEAGIDIYE